MANLKPVAPSTPDYYADLHIEQTATFAQIRGAYKQLALACHPDKIAKGKDIDAAEFRKIKDAYDFLIDGVQRANYDSEYDCLRTQWRVYRRKETLWRQNQQKHKKATNLGQQEPMALYRRFRVAWDAKMAKERAEPSQKAKEDAAAEYSRYAARRAQQQARRAAAYRLKKAERERERKLEERREKEMAAEARSKVVAERARMWHMMRAERRLQDDLRAAAWRAAQSADM